MVTASTKTPANMLESPAEVAPGVTFAALVESSPQGIVVYDALGTIHYWSAGATCIFKYSKEEAVGQNFVSLICPPTHEEKARQAQLSDLIKSGRNIVVPVSAKNGLEFPVRVHTVPIGEQYVTYVSLIESKEAAMILRSNYTYALKDVEGRYTDVSDTFATLVGVPRSEMIGKRDLDYFGEKVWAYLRPDDVAAMKGKKMVVSEEHVEMPDGNTNVYFVCRVPEIDHATGECVGLGVIGHDITEYVRTRERASELEKAQLKLSEQLALQSSQMKSNWMARMSHEVRTPINGIMGLNDLLLGTRLDNEQRDYAQEVERSCRALTLIVDDILDFSKIEAGRVTLDVLTVDLHEFLRDTAAIFRPLAHQKNLTFTCTTTPLAPPHTPFVKIDPLRLRQCLSNLVANAIKFTLHGSVVVDTRLADGMLVFEVRDTGIGVEEETVKCIFEPFTQAEGSTTRRFGGSGLGLTIAKELVALMGGDITVLSSVGKGSTFTLRVPYVEGVVPKGAEDAPNGVTEANGVANATANETANEAKGSTADTPGHTNGFAHANGTGGPTTEAKPETQAKPRRLRRGSSSGSVTGLSILVAEDNPTNIKIITRVLTNLGHTPTITTNGLACLQTLQSSPPHTFNLILMDISMPIMDGYTSATHIRALPAPWSEVAIVAVTANALPDERQRCLGVGIDEYVAKPVGRKGLEEVLERWGRGRGRGWRKCKEVGVVEDEPGEDGMVERMKAMGV
ncbi:uncharacterized protein EV422DRAFT_619132 [Fimicolochytrium jonesii]|uniref:uncharacterized protein n=1 Tax=Fimicolochytrium jonesii TaxID=1396493 RepID=UPI0022FE1979|nr:uncharacterized protein EV422DRAFT_619132 [Fimicolochytrium jonesii]KAI8822695.1 hypothetical protein EV422DRAFT_619132 [Fimicolochytrium jonesii]